MRRHLAPSAAALAAVIALSGFIAGPAFAAGPASTTSSSASITSTTATAPGAVATTTSTPTTTGASSALAKPTKPTTTSSTTPTTTTPSTPTTPTTPTPPPVAPKKAKAQLFLLDAFFINRQAVIVPDRVMQVGGVVRPYVPGQWVDVKSYIGHKLIKSDRLRLKPSRNHTYGRFTEKLKATSPGVVVIKVTHTRTPQMLGFLAQRGVASLDEHVSFGSQGQFVQLIQQRLEALHFYIPQTGVYDQGTGLALDAYHRLLGHGTSQSVDGLTISDLLDGRGSFHARYPGDGTHAEGDLSDQVLALLHGSQVYRLYPISSGKPSTPTILGRFHVYSRVPGYLPDGMYYSDFFFGGYAIHGYDPAPDYPASHGCMRLPIVDATSVFNWLNYGDAVDVYYT
jgi:lipoprotein-anchoring transpeptidase ErfK/SrfK